MALPPAAANDAFVREVDEELRRDQMTTVWRRYGVAIGAAVILGLAALAGLLYWQHRRAEQAGGRAEKLSGALADLGDGKEAPATAALTALAHGDDAAYASAARLTQAGIALTKGDAKAAAKGFDAVADDEAAPPALRDLARIRGTAAAFDSLSPQQVIDRMKPLAIAGGPWFGSAAEMTAIAYLRLGKPKPAGALFAAIARDAAVPESLRSRAVRISGMLGVDVAATAGKARG